MAEAPIFDLVKYILEHKPIARQDDLCLYMFVLYKKGIDVQGKSFFEVVDIVRKTPTLPTYASVERARRKVQEIYPELKPSEKSQEAREKLKEEYKEYRGVM